MPGRPLRVRSVLLVATASAVLLDGIAGIAAPVAYDRPGVTQMVSVTPNGSASTASTSLEQQTAWNSVAPTAVSADGRFVAFTWETAGLVAEKVPTLGPEVYVRDLRSQLTRIASVSSAGQPAQSPPNTGPFPLGAPSRNLRAVSLSATGRYVAFASDARNLVAGDTNVCADATGPCPDVFVHDMQTGRTVRVSVSSAGTQGNGSSFYPSISADGRYVAFVSYASNLVAGDTNGQPDVFVHDMRTGRTDRVSTTGAGAQESGPSYYRASISADGRSVAFWLGPSSSVALLGPSSSVVDTSCTDSGVFVKDLRTGRLTLASVPLAASCAPLGNGAELFGAESISSNGRYVVFEAATEPVVTFVPRQSHAGAVDLFVRDLETGRTERVNVNSFGEEDSNPPAGIGQNLAISSDGRYVAFDYSATNFFTPKHASSYPPSQEVYVHDLLTGTTTLISENTSGDFGEGNHNCVDGNGLATMPSLSGNGTQVAFNSVDWNLARPDPRSNTGTGCSEMDQIYVRNQGPALGVGSLAAQGKLSVAGIPGFARTGIVARSASAGNVGHILAAQGGKLIGASLAYRAGYQDLFVREQLSTLPTSSGTPVSGTPGLLYGFDLTASGIRYQVRVQRIVGPSYDAAGGASFGLFRQDPTTGLFTQVATLRGGYGTTGEEVVFALPLRDIGLRTGGKLSGLRAFTAVGTYLTGATDVLDKIALSR